MALLPILSQLLLPPLVGGGGECHMYMSITSHVYAHTSRDRYIQHDLSVRHPRGLADTLVNCRGVARSSPMLGHTTFVRNSAQSAEAFRSSGTCSVSVRGAHSDTASFDFKTV